MSTSQSLSAVLLAAFAVADATQTVIAESITPLDWVNWNQVTMAGLVGWLCFSFRRLPGAIVGFITALGKDHLEFVRAARESQAKISDAVCAIQATFHDLRVSLDRMADSHVDLKETLRSEAERNGITWGKLMEAHEQWRKLNEQMVTALTRDAR